MSGDPRNWMWSEALQMLARAERLQREVFNAPGPGRRPAGGWGPPGVGRANQGARRVGGAPPGGAFAGGAGGGGGGGFGVGSGGGYWGGGGLG